MAEQNCQNPELDNNSLLAEQCEAESRFAPIKDSSIENAVRLPMSGCIVLSGTSG
jgi:hypothetical protein